MKNDEQIQQRSRRKAVLSLCLVLLLMLAVLGGATAFLWISLPSHNHDREASISLFGVKTITVTGETRYDTDAIVEASGLRLGQSIFSLNKVAAHEAILRQFPYLATADIFNDTLNTIQIRVTETEALGAMYFDGGWLVIGSNGKGLETLELRSDTPPRYLYLKGAKAQKNAGVGHLSLDERTLKVVKTLQEAFAAHTFGGISEIDLRSLSDVRLLLNDRITIKLGNVTNLAYQIAVLSESMDYIYESYGNNARGVLDISSYSNEDSSDMVVFTPQDVLDAEATSKTANTKTTTAKSGSTAAATTKTAGATTGATTVA